MSNENLINKDQIVDGKNILTDTQHDALLNLLLNGGTGGGGGDALNSEVVHLEGNETIQGIKTFTESPQVPDPINLGDVAKVQTVLDRIQQSSAIRIVGSFGPGNSQLPVTSLPALPNNADANTYGLFPAWVCVVEEANAPLYDVNSDTEWQPLEIAIWASTMGIWLKVPNGEGVYSINGRTDNELILNLKDLADVDDYTIADIGKVLEIYNDNGVARLRPVVPSGGGGGLSVIPTSENLHHPVDGYNDPSKPSQTEGIYFNLDNTGTYAWDIDKLSFVNNPTIDYERIEYIMVMFGTGGDGSGGNAAAWEYKDVTGTWVRAAFHKHYNQEDDAFSGQLVAVPYEHVRMNGQLEVRVIGGLSKDAVRAVIRSVKLVAPPGGNIITLPTGSVVEVVSGQMGASGTFIEAPVALGAPTYIEATTLAHTTSDDYRVWDTETKAYSDDWGQAMSELNDSIVTDTDITELTINGSGHFSVNADEHESTLILNIVIDWQNSLINYSGYVNVGAGPGYHANYLGSQSIGSGTVDISIDKRTGVDALFTTPTIRLNKTTKTIERLPRIGFAGANVVLPLAFDVVNKRRVTAIGSAASYAELSDTDALSTGDAGKGIEIYNAGGVMKLRPTTKFANVNDVVNKAGSQTITGIKTFATSPLVPTTTNPNAAINLQQAQAMAGGTPILGCKRLPEYAGGRGNSMYQDGLSYINTDDEVVVIGANSDERFGNGQTNMEFPGMMIPLPAGVTEKPSKLYITGGNNILVLTEANNVFSSGKNNKNQLGIAGWSGTGNAFNLTKSAITNVKKVVVGDHGCETIGYLKHNGDLHIMGENQYGQCGNGDQIDVTVVGGPVLTNVADCISGGSWNGTNHTQSFLALLNDGSIRHVGYGGDGQSGDGGTVNAHTTWDNPLAAVTSEDIVDIQTCGGDARHTYFALTITGKLYCWGHNDRGVCGTGNSTHVTTPILMASNVAKFWCHGGYPRIFIKYNNGTIQGCGDNGRGKLSVGDTADRNVLTNVIIPAGVNIVEIYGFGGIETDGGTTIAVSDTGYLYSCGYNEHSENSLGFDSAQVTTLTAMICSFNNGRKTLASIDPTDPAICIDYVSSNGGKAFVCSDLYELYGCGQSRWHFFSRNNDRSSYLTKLHIT